jgi:hypothetical protein
VGAGEPPGDELEDGIAESIGKKSGRGRIGNFVSAMEVREYYESLKAKTAFSADPK